MTIEIEDIKFDEHGLVPAIVQDINTRRVLTLAYMNAESFARTVQTKQTWFWSRSRSGLWHKGETSGNTQSVVDMQLDCDGDALILMVEPAGPACHTGAISCFHSEIQTAFGHAESREERVADLGKELNRLYDLVKSREREMPQGSYTTYLFEQGLDKILKKVGEEASEIIIAAKNEDRDSLAKEVSDFLYHLIVLLAQRGITLEEVRDELVRRKGEQK